MSSFVDSITGVVPGAALASSMSAKRIMEPDPRKSGQPLSIQAVWAVVVIGAGALIIVTGEYYNRTKHTGLTALLVGLILVVFGIYGLMQAIRAIRR